MILVDTSVWIKFLRGNPPFFEHLSEALESDHVCTIEPVFAELLQGAKNRREVEIITAYYENLHQFDEKGLWLEAGKLSQKEKYFAKGVGLIDAVIIAAALKYKLKIWSLDQKLLSLAHPRLRYHPGG